MALAGTLTTTRIGTIVREEGTERLGPAAREDLLGIARHARKQPPHLHQALVANHPHRDRSQEQHEAVGDGRAADERDQKGQDPRPDRIASASEPGRSPSRMLPIKMLGAVPQSMRRHVIKKLLIDRLEQQAVEVAGAHQLGEFIAIVQEEHLDQAVHGEEAADEEEVLGLVPAGDRAGAGEDRAKKRDQDRQPEDLDRDLDQEVAPEGQLAGQGEPPQAAQQAKVPCRAS